MTDAKRHLHDVDSEVAVVCCTEAGKLERMSLLMCETLRLRGGRLADVPVFSFQPRPGPALSSRTRRRFAELNVVHVDAPLNVCLPSFGFANKPHAAVFAETHLPHEIIVFMDSDMLFLGEPREFLLDPDVEVALTPEVIKLAGTTGDDENAELWDTYERFLGIHGPHQYIETLRDRERIRAYYNAGFVIARRRAGLCRLWHDNLLQLATSGLVPNDSRSFFLEQIALNLGVAKLGLTPRVLPPSYDYHLPWHHELPEDIRAKSLDDITIAHYHWLLDDPTLGNPLARVKGLHLTVHDDEIAELIRSTGVTPHPLRAPLRSGRHLGKTRAERLARRIGLKRDQLTRLRPGS